MLESHVTNLDQSRKLYELGFKKPSEFVWIKTYKYSTTVDKNGDMKKEDVVILQKNGDYITQNHNPIWAYLLSELMEALPDEIKYEHNIIHYPHLSKEGKKYTAEYRNIYYDDIAVRIKDENPIEAACDLLIWCIEQWYVK